MEMMRFVKQMPTRWRGLFAALTGTECMVTAASWLIENDRDGQLSWTDLMASLLVEEPHGVNKGELIFGPRFLLLPPAMCRHVLSFLYLHRARIPESDLKHLVDKLKSFNCTDGWIKTLLQMLSDDNKADNPTYTYSTTENSNRASRLLKKLRTTTRQNIPSSYGECVDVMDVEDNDTEARVVKDDVNGNAMDVDAIKAEVSSDLPKHAKGEPLVEAVDGYNQQEKECIARIGECFHDNRDCPVSDFQMLFVGANPKKVESLANELELVDLPDNLLLPFSSMIASLAESLLLDCAEPLIEILFKNRIMVLKQNASRVVLSSVSTIVTAFPAAFMDAVLLPMATSTQSGKTQADFIQRVLKDSYDTIDGINFIRKVVEKSEILTESIIPILQILLDQKLDVQEHLLEKLVQLMEDSAAHHNKNLKFGKLILTLVNKYSSVLTKRHVTSLQACVDMHDTMLAKSAGAAIRKLQFK